MATRCSQLWRSAWLERPARPGLCRCRVSYWWGTADFRPLDVSPGQLITMFVTSVGPNTPVLLTLDASGRVTNQLAETRVFFDGTPAPMVAVARNQVSAIVPYGVEGQDSTTITVEVDGSVSNPVTLPVAAASPGIFSRSQTGVGQGAILNQDSSLNSAGNPAAKGSVIFMTGGGQTSIPGRDGELVPLTQPFPTLVGDVSVTIGGMPAQLVYTGAAPGLVWGVVQINVFVPEGLTVSGDVELEVTIAGVASQPGITVAVAP